MAFLGRQRAVRVNRHQGGAAPLGFLHPRPEMQVGGDGVAAPDDDELGIGHMLDVHADAGAVGVAQCGGTGAGADRAVKQRGAQLVKEARRHALALHQPHGARIAVWQDGLRVARGDGGQAGGHGVQRLVPGNRLELAFALAADPLHWREQAVGVVSALRVARDLGAQHALGAGVIGISRHLGRATVFDGDEQGTGIRTIVRASGTDDAGSHGFSWQAIGGGRRDWHGNHASGRLGGHTRRDLATVQERPLPG